MAKDALSRSLSMRPSGDGIRYSVYPGGTAQYTPAAPPGNDALALAAAAMAPGDWADFSMPNLARATFFAESTAGGQTILNGNFPKLTWYAANREINAVGTSHTGGTDLAGAGGLATYLAATNAWTRETYTGNSETQGHGYYHNAVNPDNGDLYWRSYNSRTIRRRVRGSSGDSWSAFTSVELPASYGNQVAGALEWFPDLNGGAGGLTLVEIAGIHYSSAPPTMATWQDGSGAAPTGIGNLHNFSAYANNRIYFGGGNSSLKMWSMNASGVVSTETDTPIECGAGTSFGQGAVFAHPNGTDLLAFAPNTGGNYWKYSGSTWTNLGAHQIGVADGIWGAVTIPDDGIVLFLKNPGGTADPPTCKLLKAA